MVQVHGDPNEPSLGAGAAVAPCVTLEELKAATVAALAAADVEGRAEREREKQEMLERFREWKRKDEERRRQAMPNPKVAQAMAGFCSYTSE